VEDTITILMNGINTMKLKHLEKTFGRGRYLDSGDKIEQISSSYVEIIM
jgi:hypothetical protein